MTHESSGIIIHSIVQLWNEKEYPGTRDHFSSKQLARIDVIATQTEFSFFDKLFLARMVRKLLFTAI